ncbi:transmembrane protein 225 [Saccopteryx leptura]|uniref:transmembrane protein 225 n=1 Tax=Saccopteryx leptura TaxID=249018 RepID=UPI00339C6D39
MVHISIRKLQAINMLLSSLVLVFLVFGIFTDEWASLKVEGADNMKRQNPWLVSTIWPNDDLKAVRIMMYLILGLSCYHNFFLGLEFTYMVTPTKCVFFITIFTSVSTGVFLISALLLYHLKLQQGLFVYYSYFKFTWVIFTAYLSASFLIASGVFSLLEYKELMKICEILKNSAREGEDTEQSKKFTQVLSPEENIEMPYSIFLVSTQYSDEIIPKASQIQKRRVTWAQ